MTVTSITEISKTRCKIEIDNQFAFVLYKGELHQYHIQEGQRMQDEHYHEIMDRVLPGRAKMRCMHLLKSRDYTETQLRTKLEQGLYPRQIIEDAISYMVSFRYVDDLRYAKEYIRIHETDRSCTRIEQDLYRKGISKQTVEQAWSTWESEGGSQNEGAMIQRLLEKKHYDPDKADLKDKQKLYAFLMRRGYSPDQIRHALKI